MLPSGVYRADAIGAGHDKLGLALGAGLDGSGENGPGPMGDWGLRATAFQADDEGSIPFTRSNVFNDLEGIWLGIVSSRAVAFAPISECYPRQPNAVVYPKPLANSPADRIEASLASHPEWHHVIHVPKPPRVAAYSYLTP
jgi:hypothetical protein